MIVLAFFRRGHNYAFMEVGETVDGAFENAYLRNQQDIEEFMLDQDVSKHDYPTYEAKVRFWWDSEDGDYIEVSGERSPRYVGSPKEIIAIINEDGFALFDARTFDFNTEGRFEKFEWNGKGFVKK